MQKSSLLVAGLTVLAAILLIPNMPINQANASTCSSSAGSGLSLSLVAAPRNLQVQQVLDRLAVLQLVDLLA
ncbi:MAG: hypothetical protein WCF23_09710 [Candidatus Nitrosopolaris sp.]